jgi:hypothetical protein
VIKNQFLVCVHICVPFLILSAHHIAQDRWSIGTSQAPLRDRLIRSGVSTQKIETFVTWRQTLAGLACSKSRDEDHLAEIAAAEKAGLTLLGELVDHLRARSRQVNAQNLQGRALAA